jgi:hypothetical protein
MFLSLTHLLQDALGHSFGDGRAQPYHAPQKRAMSREVAARVEDLVWADRAEERVVPKCELPRKLERLKARERDEHIQSRARRESHSIFATIVCETTRVCQTTSADGDGRGAVRGTASAPARARIASALSR